MPATAVHLSGNSERQEARRYGLFLKVWRSGKLSRTKDHLANSTQAGEPAEARMGKAKRKVEHCMLATQGVRFEGPGNLPRNKLVKVGSKRFLVW